MTNMDMMIFLVIVHSGSFSKAAEELYTSQSAVSRSVKSLEDELGYQLFNRKKGVRRTTLTSAGRAFVSLASKWVVLWKEMQELTTLDNQTVLNVSLINSVSAYIMPGFVSHFVDIAPWIRLTTRVVPSLDAVRYVEKGIVDVAIFSDDSYNPNLDMKPAFREKLLLLCPLSFGYPKSVHPSLLDESKHIYMPWNREYDTWYERWFPLPRRPRLWSNNFQTMEEMLATGKYWAIVPASAAERLSVDFNLSVHVLLEGPPDRIIYYLQGTHDKQVVSFFLRQFDAHLKEHCGHSVESLIQLGPESE